MGSSNGRPGCLSGLWSASVRLDGQMNRRGSTHIVGHLANISLYQRPKNRAINGAGTQLVQDRRPFQRLLGPFGVVYHYNASSHPTHLQPTLLRAGCMGRFHLPASRPGGPHGAVVGDSGITFTIGDKVNLRWSTNSTLPISLEGYQFGLD